MPVAILVEWFLKTIRMANTKTAGKRKQAGNKRLQPPQKQKKPGKEMNMLPVPLSDYPEKKGSGKLAGKVALITGADSGIGKAVALLFAKEGANIVVSYLKEHGDARDTAARAGNYGAEVLLVSGDISKEAHCKKLVSAAKKKFGRIDILVNNAATQTEQKRLEDIDARQLKVTFETNIFSMFYLTRLALPLIPEGGAIVNSTSVTAYRGSPHLMDYASTKGAIVAFTRSLSANIKDRNIRVNAVAPGPVWTPLIVSSFTPDRSAKHGAKAPMERSAHPREIAPAYLFLACDDSIYMSGQVLHPNGGEIVNG